MSTRFTPKVTEFIRKNKRISLDNTRKSRDNTQTIQSTHKFVITRDFMRKISKVWKATLWFFKNIKLSLSKRNYPTGVLM
jgi:hypothetical protein